MRWLTSLLIAGATLAPATSVAGPNGHDPWNTNDPGTTTETLEWSSSSHARLGVMVLGLTPELRSYFGAKTDRGVLVGEVAPGSPAQKAGIAVGDVVVEIHGKPVSGAGDIIAAMSGTKSGDKIRVDVIRDKKPITLDATLGPTTSAELHRHMPWFDWWTGQDETPSST